VKLIFLNNICLSPFLQKFSSEIDRGGVNDMHKNPFSVSCRVKVLFLRNEMMRQFVIFWMVVVLAVTSVGQAALVAHWTFDETGGPALDSSGNGFHGSIVGAVTRGQVGKIGGAYSFAGAGWVDFGVDTVTTRITNFPISISYWIQSTSKTATECAVWMGKRGSTQQYLQTGLKNGNANAAYQNTDFDNAVAWKDMGQSLR
jgi:hypothetical protein